MKLDIKNKAGAGVGELEVRDDVFCVPEKSDLVHQVFVSQLANKRQGTAKTKNRSEVSGGGAKPRPQKGSGRSRQGSIRSPLWVGGGRAFGPSPRSYRKKVPKTMRRLAILSLISDRVRNGNLILVDGVDDLEARTKAAVGFLGGLKVDESALIVTDEVKNNAVKAFQNIQRVETTHAQVLNALDLINKKKLIMTVDAVKRVEALWGGVYKGLVETHQPAEDVESVGVTESGNLDESGTTISEHDSIVLEELQLSTRTLNILKGAGLDKVGDVFGQSKTDLLKIKNFGEKSYIELQSKLNVYGFLTENLHPENKQPSDDADAKGGI